MKILSLIHLIFVSRFIEDYIKYIKETWPILDIAILISIMRFSKMFKVLSDYRVMVAIIPNSYLTTNSAKILENIS